MTNTRKELLKAAFNNVDSDVYSKNIREWTDDVISSFGKFLLTIYSNEKTESNRRFYCGPKITAEILEWFHGAHAAYYMQCLGLLENESDWDDGNDEGTELDPGYELEEYIRSRITDDVAEEVMLRLEKQLAENAGQSTGVCTV